MDHWPHLVQELSLHAPFVRLPHQMKQLDYEWQELCKLKLLELPLMYELIIEIAQSKIVLLNLFLFFFWWKLKALHDR